MSGRSWFSSMLLRGLLAMLLSAYAGAQPVVIEAGVERPEGAPPAVIRGLLDPAPRPAGPLLMVFPGWPGIPRIETRDGRPAWLYLQQHVEELKPLLHRAGISLMTVDCPTDQWGARGFNPTACDDHYRSSPQHADDVRRLMQRVREAHDITSVYLMGHSYGAVSSHWLAIHLGEALAGSIHSATQSVPGGGPFTQYAFSVARIEASRLPRNSVYLHHRDDLCRFTPYAFARQRGGERLMTVVGGNRAGDPCGKASFHSYAGRSQDIGAALVRWIQDGVITPQIGAEGD